jgi:hypothetical protein
VLNDRGKKQEAIDCYHHAIEYNPNTPTPSAISIR